jgi:hypothetical protein
VVAVVAEPADPTDNEDCESQLGADVPFELNICPVVPAAVNPVVLAADCQGISPANPPATLVACTSCILI